MPKITVNVNSDIIRKINRIRTEAIRISGRQISKASIIRGIFDIFYEMSDTEILQRILGENNEGNIRLESKGNN